MRIDRVLRQLSFREPGQKDLIGSFRARARTPHGSADDKTAVRSFGHARPALSPQPSPPTRQIGLIKLPRGLHPRTSPGGIRAAWGPRVICFCRAEVDSLPVTGFLSTENYDTSYI